MDQIRMFIHIFAASIWVGGQIVMGSLVPTLREIGDGAPAKAAQAFNRGLPGVRRSFTWVFLAFDQSGRQSQPALTCRSTKYFCPPANALRKSSNFGVCRRIWSMTCGLHPCFDCLRRTFKAASRCH